MIETLILVRPIGVDTSFPLGRSCVVPRRAEGILFQKRMWRVRDVLWDEDLHRVTLLIDLED